MPRNPEWRTIHGVADNRRAEMRRAFMRGIERFASDIVLIELERAFEAGDIGAIEAAIPWEDLPAQLEDMADEILRLVESGARASLKHLPNFVQANLRFDLLNPRSVNFIREYRFNLIREITAESREAIRRVVLRAFEEGMHPYKSARYIRDIVGLTERQALAVDNYRRSLLAQGVPEGRALEMVNRYANRVHRRRAETIARTETIRAASAGQTLLWQEGTEEGLIEPARTWRVWIVTPDDRLCDICEPMDGQRVRMDEAFQSSIGPIFDPPVHPNCRCAVSLDFDD